MVGKKVPRAGGRPQHNFWIEGKFLLTTEKNRPAALCKICSKVIHNTAKKRLMQHRKNCKGSSPTPDSLSSDTDTEETENNHEIEACTRSKLSDNIDTSEMILIDPLPDETEEVIQIIVEDETDHNYSRLIPHPSNPSNPSIEYSEVAGTSTPTRTLERQAKKKQSGLLSFLDPGPGTSTSNIHSNIHPASEAPNVASRSRKALKRKISEDSNNDSSFSLISSSDLTVPRKKLYEKNIQSFIDTLSPEDKENIDLALAKFIFGCNIPFSTVESDHFKKLISKLRPAYKLPTRKTIATTLLDQVYKEMNKTDAEQCGEESVLLIDGWKNSTANTKNVLTMIHNNYGHVAFLESFDFSEQSETGEELSKIIMKSRQIAREKFSTEIYAVVSDNASNMLKMGRIINESDILHSGCNSHMGNLLAKEVVDEDIATKVTSLQKEFKNPSFEKKMKRRVVLPADTRWCSQRDRYENFLSNLTTMRQIVIDEQVVFKNRLKHLLFDDEFIEQVEIQKEALDPICNLVNKCQQRDCNLADAVEMWLTLKVPEEYEGKLKRRQEKVFTKHALAANYLHPIYRGNNLNEEQTQLLNIICMKI